MCSPALCCSWGSYLRPMGAEVTGGDCLLGWQTPRKGIPSLYQFRSESLELFLLFLPAINLFTNDTVHINRWCSHLNACHCPSLYSIWGPPLKKLTTGLKKVIGSKRKATRVMETSVFSWGNTGSSDSKQPTCNAGDPASILGLGRSPGEGNGNPLQYLENSMDRGAW